MRLCLSPATALAVVCVVHYQNYSLAQDKTPVATVVVPFVAKHCVSCHGPQKKKADLTLHQFTDEASILKARKTWMQVLNMLHAGEMPPSGRPRPETAEAEKFHKTVSEIFERHDRTAKRDPGHVTMRRLNRVEYQNTIKDLVGVDIPIGEDFPTDDVGHGFDNIGDVLTISPLHTERYLAAAEIIMKNAITVGEAPKPPVRTQAGRFLEPALPVTIDRPRPLYTKGPLHTPFKLNQGGKYKMVVRMFGEPAGDEKPKAAILLDGKAVKEFELTNITRNSGKNFSVDVDLKPGTYRVGVSLLNEYTAETAWHPPLALDKEADKKRRGLLVEYIQLIGPMDTRPESHLALLDAPKELEGEAKTRHVLERFVTRAYRRPATKEEVDRLVKLVKNCEALKEPWEAGIQLAMEGVLVSPKFLFRVELDARPDARDAHPIDDYQLASRLSYFLWSTMPDNELFDLAAKKQLHKQIPEQVKRMLADPRSQALIDNFAGQWLQLRPLKNASPDRKLFPEFDDRLRKDMLEETNRFFGTIMKEDRSVLELIDGKFTYLNERLARLYGIRDTNGNPEGGKAFTKAGAPIKGDGFVRVNLEGSTRGGLLTQASVLTVTSNPTRTSPVKRGRWVLEQILGTPPPPPPPNVPELEEESKAQTKGSLRQRMEQHRANASCAGCHARMDPIGFAFENFNAIGKFRVKDGEFAIDPAGELPGGQKFNGPEELKTILKSKKELFTRCLAEKMLTYATGRGSEYYDKPAIDGVLAVLEKNEYRFSSLIVAIAQSDPFRLRRGKDQE